MSRVRVLLGTNVLISAVLFGGVPGRIIDAARDRDIHAAVSLHILGEFREVLMRPRFGVDPDTVDALVEEVARFCDVVPVERASGAWCEDPDDDPVIEAALSAGVAVVVTGDAHVLSLQVPGLRILAPAEFARVYLGR